MSIPALCRLPVLWAALLLSLPPAAVAAPNSTQSPPPRADAIGGDTPAGDPNGAVRALGQANGNDTRRKPMVDVPHLGGEGPDEPGRLPAGTTR